MIDFNAIVTLAGMLASLAIVFVVLEASSIAVPAALKRAATWINPHNGHLVWAQRHPAREVSGIASFAGRKLHATLTRPSMNTMPIRQAA